MTQREMFESEAAHEVNIILDNLYKLQDLSICSPTPQGRKPRLLKSWEECPI